MKLDYYIFKEKNMKSFKILIALMLSLVLLLALVSCNDTKDSDADTDSGINTDSETDTEIGSDSTVDSDLNADVDTDSDSNVDADTDSDSNVDTETDTDTDTDTETDTDTDTDIGYVDTPWQSQASAEVIEKAEALLQSKHRLEYNEDGSFRVMIIADAHMSTNGASGAVSAVKERIKTLVDKINPNLIILTGDNTINSSSETQLRANIDAIVSYIEEKKIPWCHVYGNHDHENALSNAEQQPIYQSYEYCISKDVESLSGTGTYVHGIYNKDGSLGSLVWLIDSGAYASGGGYDYIKQDQIDWYKETSLLIKEYNNGTTVKGMMAFHIPLIENRTADASRNDTTIVYETDGTVNEPMCPSNTDTNLLETIFELGDVKLIVTGHDHKNDYMFNYKGVKLSSSPNISDLTYFDPTYQGSRVMDLDATKLDNIPTYVEYIFGRLDPESFPSLENDIVIEDFESKFATPVVSGWANNGLTGTATIEKADGKGVGGSDALSISRDNVSNFEFVIDISQRGKLGNNKYVVLWMDFTQVDFRKACIGLASAEGADNPYRTDDYDGVSGLKYYYLADGSNEWVEYEHGTDGCFGREQEGSVLGQKGYFAFPISDFRQGGKAMTENTLVTGIYFYGSLWWGDAYLNKPLYIDNVMLCESYTDITLPTE